MFKDFHIYLRLFYYPDIPVSFCHRIYFLSAIKRTFTFGSARYLSTFSFSLRNHFMEYCIIS